MPLSLEDVKKIAHLARLNLSEEAATSYTSQLSKILEFVNQMNQANTAHIEPLASPLELLQRLRNDQVTETNQREKIQAVAPLTQAGLYLVPKVIEEA